MSVYMAERSLPGIGMDDLAAAQKRVIDTARRMSGEGTAIEYLRTTFVPGEDRCMCLFEAASAGDVEKLNQDAEVPYERVVEALDLRP